MTLMKFVDKNLRYRVCGVTVIQSYNAFKCKCKFSMVRKEQHGKCHILLLLQNDSPETGPQGIYKYTDSCLWHEKYWFPIRSHPCSSLQSAAEKNLLNVMKQGKKQTNRKKNLLKPQNKNSSNIGMGSTYCFFLCASESLGEAVKGETVNV